MATNTDKPCPKGQWTLLTDTDVTAVSFQNKTDAGVYIVGRGSADPAPASTSGAICYLPYWYETNINLADLFVGMGYTRLWALSPYLDGNVAVAHA